MISRATDCGADERFVAREETVDRKAGSRILAMARWPKIQAMLGITDSSRKWWVLVAMSVGGGLMMLDETVVGVALPAMRHDLGMSNAAAHWVINAYMLVFAGLAAAAGRLGDIIGFKLLMLAGVAIFGVASLVAGFADSGAFLIAVRAVEGVGAAVILPGTVAMIMLVFPPEQRGMAIGTLAAIATSFLAMGPLVGGS